MGSVRKTALKEVFDGMLDFSTVSSGVCVLPCLVGKRILGYWSSSWIIWATIGLRFLNTLGFILIALTVINFVVFRFLIQCIHTTKYYLAIKNYVFKA